MIRNLAVTVNTENEYRLVAYLCEGDAEYAPKRNKPDEIYDKPKIIFDNGSSFDVFMYDWLDSSNLPNCTQLTYDEFTAKYVQPINLYL